jgi:hypothetical protein
MKEPLGASHYRPRPMGRKPRADDLRRRLARFAAIATCVVAGASAATSYREIWDGLSGERARDEVLTAQERDRAPIASIPLPVEVFEFWSAFLLPGDRVYFHVLESGFSDFVDLPTVVAASGRFSLLPATQVRSLDQANVVVSWQRDPAELGYEFEEQHQAGQQPFFVSRIAR